MGLKNMLRFWRDGAILLFRKVKELPLFAAIFAAICVSALLAVVVPTCTLFEFALYVARPLDRLLMKFRGRDGEDN